MHELGFENYINAGQSSVSVLLLQRYRELGLTDQELLVFLQTKAMLDQGATEPNTTQIGEYMGLSAKTVFSVLESIRSKGLIQTRKAILMEEIHNRPGNGVTNL